MTALARSTSIGTRLTSIIVAATSIVLCLAAIVFGFHDREYARDELASDLQVTAKVLGTNVRSALEFDDAGFVVEQLQQLTRDVHVLGAVVTDARGNAFAAWARAGGPGIAESDVRSTRFPLWM